MRTVKYLLLVAWMGMFLTPPTNVQANITVNFQCPSFQRSTPMIYVQRIQFPPTENEESYYLVSLTDYIIGVVEGEIFPGAGDDPDGYSDWMDATLKAQAVLARTYAYRFCGDQPITDKNKNPVIDPVTGQQAIGTNDRQQAYRPQADVNYEYLRSFIEQGLYLAPSSNYNQPIEALYKSYTHGSDGMTLNANSNGPLKGIYDPISLVDGHGSLGRAYEGLGQNSADHWARGESHAVRFPKWDYTKILAHYYTNVQLVDAAGIGSWGDYRWNLLNLEPSPSSEIYYENEGKSVTLTIQNTGTTVWQSGTRLIYCWQRKSTAGTSCSSWYTAAVSIPTLSPGASTTLPAFTVYPSAGMYINKDCCSYQLVWDLQLSGGTRFNQQGWLNQEWAIRLRKRVQPPTPPSQPHCPQPPCATNSSPSIVGWGASPYNEGLVYDWRTTTDQGSLIASGSVPSSQTSAAIALVQGNNTVAVRGRDSQENDNTSSWVTLTTINYDTTPPIIATFTTLPTWSNATEVALGWQANDAQTGVANYTLEQQLNGGIWTALVTNGTATNYTVTNLANNNDYTFRLTVRDNAGNSTQQTRTMKIDRNTPTATLTAPAGSLTKTWTIVQWTNPEDGRSPVTFQLERLVNGVWQPLTTMTNGLQRTALLVGQPNTTYALRVWASDAAGNQQTVSATAQITFTTGTDTSGLATVYLPVMYTTTNTTSSAAPSNTTTTAYPLPGQ